MPSDIKKLLQVQERKGTSYGMRDWITVLQDFLAIVEFINFITNLIKKLSKKQKNPRKRSTRTRKKR